MADSDQTPWWDAPDEFRRMRDVLAQAGYTHAALKTRGDTTPAAGPLAEAVQRRRTASETPLDTLVRLFAYSLPVHGEAAARPPSTARRDSRGGRVRGECSSCSGIVVSSRLYSSGQRRIERRRGVRTEPPVIYKLQSSPEGAAIPPGFCRYPDLFSRGALQRVARTL